MASGRIDPAAILRGGRGGGAASGRAWRPPARPLRRGARPSKGSTIGPIGKTAAELVLEDHRPLVREFGQRVEVVVRDAGCAVERQQRQSAAVPDHVVPDAPAGDVDVSLARAAMIIIVRLPCLTESDVRYPTVGASKGERRDEMVQRAHHTDDPGPAIQILTPSRLSEIASWDEFEQFLLANPDRKWELHDGVVREKPGMSAEHNEATTYLGLSRSRVNLTAASTASESTPRMSSVRPGATTSRMSPSFQPRW